MNPFQRGDQVIFYKDDFTSKFNGTTVKMEEFLDSGAILIVDKVLSKGSVRCKGPGGWYHAYNVNDLKLAIKTEDESFLDSLYE